MTMEGRRGMDVGLIQEASKHTRLFVCMVCLRGQEVMELLERGLRGMGVELIRIDGATPPHKRYLTRLLFRMGKDMA